MAQKKRGLGRGLQALIPEAQAENPSRRPMDVFFPSGASDQAHDGEASSHAADIASTLLAPSKRMQASKRGAARKGDDVSRETSASGESRRADLNTSVSRETFSSRRSGSQGSARERAARGEIRSTAAEAESAVAAGTGVTADGGALVPVPGATFADLPVALIQPNPRQPRQVFDDDDIAELAASIKEVGLLQPIVVRRVDGPDGEATHYELIMGERRLRASKEAGLETIPAVVRYTEDEDLLRDALLENLHRVQLNPLEEAAAYQQLLEDFSCTHAELSQRIARSRSQISNTLRLMKLPPLVQRRVAAGVLSAGHARALLGLPDAAAMERLAQRIVAEGLSVRATEELVAVHDEPAGDLKVPVVRARTTSMPQLSSRLSDVFDTRVKVTKGAKKGRITIEFAGSEDLERIVSAIAPGTDFSET
nr:ParB/RepB/Spo0J family partition protein [Actinomyces sp.]